MEITIHDKRNTNVDRPYVVSTLVMLFGHKIYNEKICKMSTPLNPYLFIHSKDFGLSITYCIDPRLGSV